jgi:membrane-bound ClpP family serine protease
MFLGLLRCWRWLALALLGACGGPVARVDLAAAGQPTNQTAVEPLVLLVTLEGKLGTQEIARCHRSLREAESRGLRVVFRLRDAGSQGEDAGDVQSLLDHLQQTPVDTTAVLQGRIVQGAAALAVCCKAVYCLPDVQWGEINKPEQELDELLADDPDVELAARLAAAREAMQTRLQRRANRLRPDAEKLALAMVDPRIQLVAATVREGGIERQRLLEAAELSTLQASGAKVFGERTLPRPLMVTAQEAEDFGLCTAQLSNLDSLADVLNIDRSRIGELTVNWAEDMVGWLELLQPFLLVAGFLLLLIEVKTPGVGLPGLLGVVFLGLAMFHSYLVGLAEVTEILVFFLGIAAIAVEIFLLPGTVVFGAVGFLCLVLALILSQQSFVLPSNAIEEGILVANLTNLLLLFVLVLALGMLLWRLLPKVPYFNRLFLAPPEAVPAGAGAPLVDTGALALVGRVGTAATPLRPAGAIDIDGQRLDVVTEGEFLAAGTAVRVLYVQGNRVVVGQDGSAAGGNAAGGPAGQRGSVGVVLLLCVVGLLLIVVEVMFVSFGVVALLAGVALLSAVFVAFQQSVAFGVTMVVTESIAAPVVLGLAMRLLPKTRFGKQLILAGPDAAAAVGAAGGAVDPDRQALLRRHGVAVSPLRPSGFARIDGRRVDVTTRGEMLDADCPVVVIEVTQNRVVVARADR